MSLYVFRSTAPWLKHPKPTTSQKTPFSGLGPSNTCYIMGLEKLLHETITGKFQSKCGSAVRCTHAEHLQSIMEVFEFNTSVSI